MSREDDRFRRLEEENRFLKDRLRELEEERQSAGGTDEPAGLLDGRPGGALLATLVEAWDGMIYICTPDFRIGFMNRRFKDLLGRDATGELCHLALHGRHDPCPWCPREVFQGQSVRGRFQKPTDERWYDVSNVPLPLPDGSFAKAAFIRETAESESGAVTELPVFQHLVDQLSDAVFFHDPQDGRVLYANEAACRSLGFSRPELLGMGAWDFCEAVASVEDWRNRTADLERSGSALLETRRRRSDGTAFDVEVKLTAIRAGLQRLVVSVARDIGVRKEAERRLVEERNKVEAIMAAIGDGITVLDRDFRIIYQNEVQIAKRGNDLGEHCYRAYQKLDRVCDDCQAEKCFADGHIHRRETTAPTPRGIRHIEVTASPLRDAAGRITACVEVVRDLTEQKRIEQELRESNEKYRLLFCAESEAILTYDAQTGEIQEVNETACRLYGRSPADFIGRRWPDLVAEAEEVSGRVRSSLHRRGDGTVFPVEFSLGTFQWQGRPTVVATVRDISERRRLERSREEVFSVVSHEMRTPLTAILGFTEFLLGNAAEPEMQKELLGMILKQSERLMGLIDNVLSLQRLRAGFGLENPVPVLLPPLLQEVMESFRTPLAAQPIEIECPLDLPPVLGEAEKIQHAVKNLLGNAVKYSPPGSRILLGVQAEGAHALLWVRDEGPGIAADQQEKIFERFYRVGGCRGPAGTGLGLALVREIAEAHCGRAWVRSALGKGSTFYLTLPFAAG